MKKIILFFSFFYCFNISVAQIADLNCRIVVNATGVFIKNININKNSSPSEIEAILGKPDDISKGFLNTVWNFKNCGIQIYLNPETNMITSIEIYFKNVNVDFVLFAHNIDSSTYMEKVKSISELKTPHQSGDLFYSAQTNDLKITCAYSNSGKLEGVGISFL